MAELTEKKVNLSQLIEDLNSGLTRWKKDDIGFGSLEKKYNLSTSEMAQILTHPRLKNVESKIPTFIIVDDLKQEEAAVTATIQVAETQIVEKKEEKQVQTTVVVKETSVQPKKKIEAFI